MRTRSTQGFTLLETLVAVLILTTAISGPLVIAQRGLSATLIAKDQVTAYYLAQDAVEYVHYLRDTACLAAGTSPCAVATWLPAASAPAPLSSCSNSSPCQVDSLTTNKVCIIGVGCSRQLYYNNATASFTTDSTMGTLSPFSRTVTLTEPSGSPLQATDNEAILTVVVQWTDAGARTRSVTTQENIFNWE